MCDALPGTSLHSEAAFVVRHFQEDEAVAPGLAHLPHLASLRQIQGMSKNAAVLMLLICVDCIIVHGDHYGPRKHACLQFG